MTGLPARGATTDTVAVREGIITGLLGAAVVASFYFVVDLARGLPFRTPSVLGEAFILRMPATAIGAPDATAVVLYTLVHLLVFVAFGLFLAALVHAAETSDLARYAIVQLFIVFELFFYGLLFIGSETARGLFPLWSVLAANTLAAIVMATWQWRHHPALRAALQVMPLGGEHVGV